MNREPELVDLHPRLRRRHVELGKLLGLDDPTELAAAIYDIQTLLVRCGYHLRLIGDDRAFRSKPSSGAAVRRGRPKGSVNWAARQLALGLAVIWNQHSTRKPTRRFNAYRTAYEYGPYREFVELIRDALPLRLRGTRKGLVPEVDHLVRIGIEEFKAAQLSNDESRHRGLIEKGRWLENDCDPNRNRNQHFP